MFSAHQDQISTHAPLAGRDYCSGARRELDYYRFQPTRPLRGATIQRLHSQRAVLISTHAPLAGRDSKAQDSRGRVRNFNPRAPCGARPCWPAKSTLPQRFQPTRPLRGATQSTEESDVYQEFQPTRPLRGATASAAGRDATDDISTHAPLAGRDPVAQPVGVVGKISTHAPLAGRDSKSVQITMHIFAITDKFQMLLHRMPPVRAFCSFLMQENHADFGCEPPK